MKKQLLTLIIFIFSLLFSTSLAYSDNFSFMISTMQIPTTNVHGKSLNEEIYNKYSLFVYGSPNDGYIGQRWKNVEQGNWSNGSNIGEFWILGENSDGYEVHNHKFPVDVEPPTSPETWRYAIINDAKESWQDQSKYMDDIQKEYMLNTKLTRNEVAYNLTANQIGLDKVRLENYATWKTKGTVYTQRYDKQNKKWAANFMVPAMAADSKILGYAIFPNGETYNPSNEVNSISIPMTFGADAIDLTEYAKKEHVKEIKSQLFINNQLIDEISKSEVLSISKDTNYTAFKSMDNEVVVLNISVRSTLYTKFTTDGVLTDIQNYTVIVYFGEVPEKKFVEESYTRAVMDVTEVTNELIPPPLITDIKITRMKNGEFVDLLVAKKTNQEFVCAGQTIKIEVKVINPVDYVKVTYAGDSSIFTFDEATKKAEWDEPKSRGKKTFYSTLNNFKNMYRTSNKMTMESYSDSITTFTYLYIIPYGTKQTLNSWTTLREQSQNAFDINEKQLFTRIKKPYEIVFKATGFGGTTTKRIGLDVFERWDTLYNRSISKYVVNDKLGW